MKCLNCVSVANELLAIGDGQVIENEVNELLAIDRLKGMK